MTKQETIKRLRVLLSVVEQLPESADILTVRTEEHGDESVFLFCREQLIQSIGPVSEEHLADGGGVFVSTILDGVKVFWYESAETDAFFEVFEDKKA